MTLRKVVMVLAATLALASAAPSALLRAGLAADWPQWRGINRDAV